MTKFSLSTAMISTVFAGALSVTGALADDAQPRSKCVFSYEGKLPEAHIENLDDLSNEFYHACRGKNTDDMSQSYGVGDNAFYKFACLAAAQDIIENDPNLMNWIAPKSNDLELNGEGGLTIGPDIHKFAKDKEALALWFCEKKDLQEELPALSS